MSNKDKSKLNTCTWVLLIATLCMYLPMLIDYFGVLQWKIYYRFYPLVIFAVGIILYQRWKQAPPAERFSPRWPMWFLGVGAIPVTLIALLYFIPWLSALAFLMLLGAGFLYLASCRKIENLMGIFLLLFLLLRPPYQLIVRMMVWMENLSAQWASAILDYRNVTHSLQGNILALPQHDFPIDTICSGLVSVLSMVATAAVICVIKNRKLMTCLMTFVLAVVSTWLLNVCRILMAVSIFRKHEIDVLSGGYLVGFVIVSAVFSLLLVLSADALSAFLLSGIDRDANDLSGARRPRGMLAKLWNAVSNFSLFSLLGRFSVASKPSRPGRGVIITLIIVLVGLSGMEAVIYFYRMKTDRRQFMYGEDDLSKISRQTIKFDRPGWEVISAYDEKREFASIWGALSNTWRLKYNGINVIMSLDYPFDNWHDVKSCYNNIGWTINAEKTLRDGAFSNWGASETYLTVPNGDAGFVICSHSDHVGDVVQPKPATHRLGMLRYRLHPDQWSAPFGKSMDRNKRTFYQTQCMVSTPLPLDEATQEEIRLMYAQFREQARRAIARQSLQQLN
ncbi:hypothetical protein NT6N_27020 [Oceaniferula spumae]|uniref:Exosortase/archaeosortase family protein n=1 Tax=Oceaniferula spumae TaxID=2979115 RepID=A0AAT9FNW4_9BACT